MNKLNLILFTLLLSGCISVKIGDQSSKKSSRYSYTAPSKEFSRIKDDAVDIAWLSQKTAATLSVKSRCAKNLELDLEDWFADLASNFKANQNVSVNKLRFNNRKAIRGELETSVEGYENKFVVTSFIKNSCQYIIVLTAPKTSYESEIAVYDKFLESFKAW